MVRRCFTAVLGLFISVSAVTAAAEPRAQEPAYCDLNAFLKSEVAAPISQSIQRLHLYRLGNVTVAGMAMGLSKTSEMEALAESFSAGANVNFCTWYLNKGNTEAEKSFNHHYVDNPNKLTPEQAVTQFMGALQSSFTNGANTFLACAETRGYIAMGCNGQMHRGPSGIGMLLAFSGCTPEHAEAIVDRIWGLNGVQYNVRLSIIQAGFDLGSQNPALRQRLQHAFSGR